MQERVRTVRRLTVTYARDPQSDGLRRAVSYMHRHLDADIGLRDIADAAGTSPRAVQYLFRRHLDTTPLAYLRRLRLDQVRRDLLCAGPGATVSGIASRWGFFHLGRFSAFYLATYGEHPRETLRRAGVDQLDAS